MVFGETCMTLLTRNTQGALAQNSVRWSNFEDQDPEAWKADIVASVNGSGIKAQRIQEWNVKWEAFCEWIVQEYGDKYPVK